MKMRIQGLVAVAVIVFTVALAPLSAIAGDHGGWWYHDHGNHWGWYNHHGGYGGYGAPGYAYGGYPGGWHCHHHHDWDDDDGEYGGPAYGQAYSGPAYGGYAPYGGYGYSGYPLMAPSALSYPPAYSGYGSYAPMGNLGNMGRMMRRQQLASQRLTANQNLYQAAMAQGNYALANKAAAHIQKQSTILNAANAMFGAGAAAPAYPGYGLPNYGPTPYYGQPGYGALGASPLSSILQMLP
jgi:hypothetical protein